MTAIVFSFREIRDSMHARGADTWFRPTPAVRCTRCCDAGWIALPPPLPLWVICVRCGNPDRREIPG